MKKFFLVLLAATVAGCASEQEGTLSCPAPGETGCDSLDTVYQETIGTDKEARTTQSLRHVRQVPTTTEPGLRKAKVVRIWLAPWQDEDGDLHDQQYLYLVLTPPAWNVDHLVRPPLP